MIPPVSENVKPKSMSHGPNESISHESAYILALYAVPVRSGLNTDIVIRVNTDRSIKYSDFAGFTGLKFSYKGHEDVIFILPYVT